jgi:hypothetical protein
MSYGASSSQAQTEARDEQDPNVVRLTTASRTGTVPPTQEHGVRHRRNRSKNGFFQFACALRRRRGVSLQAAIALAEDIWPEMDEEARRPYKEQAIRERPPNLPCPREDCRELTARVTQLDQELQRLRRRYNALLSSLRFELSRIPLE